MNERGKEGGGRGERGRWKREMEEEYGTGSWKRVLEEGIGRVEKLLRVFHIS